MLSYQETRGTRGELYGVRIDADGLLLDVETSARLAEGELSGAWLYSTGGGEARYLYSRDEATSLEGAELFCPAPEVEASRMSGIDQR